MEVLTLDKFETLLLEEKEVEKHKRLLDNMLQRNRIKNKWMKKVVKVRMRRKLVPLQIKHIIM